MSHMYIARRALVTACCLLGGALLLPTALAQSPGGPNVPPGAYPFSKQLRFTCDEMQPGTQVQVNGINQNNDPVQWSGIASANGVLTRNWWWQSTVQVRVVYTDTNNAQQAKSCPITNVSGHTVTCDCDD